MNRHLRLLRDTIFFWGGGVQINQVYLGQNHIIIGYVCKNVGKEKKKCCLSNAIFFSLNLHKKKIYD